MDAIMVSNFLASKAGIMPSHSCSTSTHSRSSRLQTSCAKSMSKPFSVPSASFHENGGYAPSTPTRSASALTLVTAKASRPATARPASFLNFITLTSFGFIVFLGQLYSGKRCQQPGLVQGVRQKLPKTFGFRIAKHFLRGPFGFNQSFVQKNYFI